MQCFHYVCIIYLKMERKEDEKEPIPVKEIKGQAELLATYTLHRL